MVMVLRKALGVPEMLEQDYCKACFYQVIPSYCSNGLCYCVYVLGLARTGLIFTGLQEGAQPGGGG